MSHYVVVGAGVAGLTIAHQLSAKRQAVTVVERDAVVGGLARSWHYGDFHFDVGPHRFHTEHPRVSSFIRQVLGDDVLDIRRKSGVRMFGGFHEWPLRPRVLLSMPFSYMLRGAFDVLRRERLSGDSFEADIINKYGRTLYSIFFEPYTRKFNFASPRDLHQDWGRAGVNRAVIDKRASADTLWSLLKTTLLPKPVETAFLYSPRGVGAFSEKLADAITASGGRVLLECPVTGLDTDQGRVTAVRTARERIPCDGVIWTAPLPLAASLLNLPQVDLKYLSTVFYNFEINAPDRIGFQWTYYGGDEVFSRVSSPVAFAPTMAPKGKSSLCVEVTCRGDDAIWRNPEALTDRVVADLVRTGTIARAEDIGAVHVERMPQTYPIYKLMYLAELTRSLRELGQYGNLLMAGRTGRFWYNNMDHSIGQGLTMAEKVLRGEALAAVDSDDREFWKDAPAAEPAASPDPTDSHPTAAPAGRRWAVPAVGAALAGVVAALAWQFGQGLGGALYALLYLLALVPGLPVGFALFGRRQAAGWVAGGLVGYVMTGFGLWLAIAGGMPRAPAMVAAWAAMSAATWLPYALWRPAALVKLPTWRRTDTLALLLVLLIVPGLLAPTLSKVGAVDQAGNERYRAYFTADFLWHAALTAELARFDMPPKDPYAGDHTLNYYWAYFLLPGSALGTDPFGLWHSPIPILKVNRVMSGLLFIGMLAVFAWSIVPRAGAMVAAVVLSVLASSAEGSYALYDVVTTEKTLESLRHINVDALTAWVLDSLTIDGLPRSLWYTPQHAMACALGLVALTVAGGTRKGGRVTAALLAGMALGGAVGCSPFLGGAFALIYGASVLFVKRGGWRETARAVAVHAAAAGPVLMAVGWCKWNEMFEGADAAIALGYSGPITRAPLLMPLLTLGPIMLAAVVGVWRGRSRAAASLAPSLAGVGIGFTLLYFVSMPGGDLVWVGWRAGQILLLTMTPLAALGFAWVADTKHFSWTAWAAAGALFVIGLPTTVIDTYNAQDIWNRRMGPGFRWTFVVTPDERLAFDWIRKETPVDALVQMEPIVRGRETWTQIPTFAHRRMAAGLPISLLRKSVYTDRSGQMRTLYATDDVPLAIRLAWAYGVDYIYMDSTDRRAYGIHLDKFDNNPQYFERVFKAGDVSVYRVVPPSEGSS
jgi:protoporphyrinogen oxidase